MEPRGTRVYGMHGFASLEARAGRYAGNASCDHGEDRLDAAQVRELDRFLAGVERRAFRIAQCALRDADDAHDVVQVAMLRLAQSYAARPVEEWKPLFYRILYNGIRDLQRRHGVRRRFLGWLPGASRHEDEAGEDPLEQVPDTARPSPCSSSPRTKPCSTWTTPCVGCRHDSSRRSRCAASKDSTWRLRRPRWAAARAA